jgi:hypothetical protein
VLQSWWEVCNANNCSTIVRVHVALVVVIVWYAMCLVLWTQIEFCLSPENNPSLIHFGYLHFWFKLIGHTFLVISIPLKFTNQIHSQRVYLEHWMLFFSQMVQKSKLLLKKIIIRH